MKTFKLNQLTPSLIILVLVLFLAGCQEAAPTPEIIYDKTISCEAGLYEEGTALVENAGAEYAEVRMGTPFYGRLECEDAYLKGNFIGVIGQTPGSASAISYLELATDEGGYWRCNGELRGDSNVYTCQGDLKYSGLEMQYESTTFPNETKFTITRAVED